MFYGILAVVVVLCVLLILVILVQNPKGGLSGEFGGAASQMMGAQRSTDLLEKLTFGFMFAIAVLVTYANLDIQPSNFAQEQLLEEEQTEEGAAEDLSIKEEAE